MFFIIQHTSFKARPNHSKILMDLNNYSIVSIAMTSWLIGRSTVLSIWGLRFESRQGRIIFISHFLSFGLLSLLFLNIACNVKQVTRTFDQTFVNQQRGGVVLHVAHCNQYCNMEAYYYYY